MQKQVVQIKATTVLKRVLTLCDASIYTINMLNMQHVSGLKIKLVNIFAINEKPLRRDPFAIEVCVGTRKKSIQIFSIKDDQCLLLREFQLDSSPIALKVDGSVMCVGLSGDYRMISCDSGAQQDLFEFDSRQVRPIVVYVSQNEYLLSASNALGIFALSDGISRRPPLQWINNIISVSHVHPYVVVLNDEFMTVHSILDQQQKQTIQFSGGIATCESSGKVFVATKNDVYCLLPEPFDRQIQSLLLEHRITEALELAKSVKKDGNFSQDLSVTMKRIELQAGFVEFCRQNFEEATTHFNNGGLDPRELISLYPGLLPESSKFSRSQPPLHDVVDINHLSNGQSETVERFESYLFTYLRILLPQVKHDHKSDVMTAYLKLLGKLQPSKLLSSISKFEDLVDVDSCIEYFKKQGNHHCSAILLCNAGSKEAAVETWKKICGGELKDAMFPGFPFVVDSLCKMSDESLIWKHSDWFMERDQRLAVKIFIDQCDKLGLEKVVEYLGGFKEASVLFLEDLIYKKKSQNEKYHSLLSNLYLDEVLSLKESNDESKLSQARQKLCHFLKVSNNYRVSSLLPKAEGSQLYHECALLYGKLEDHQTALNILAEKVQNFEEAEDYCMVYSQGKPSSYRANLFETLLTIYLNAKNFKEHYLEPTLALLNKHENEFDAIKVIQAIPNNWSNAIVEDFLLNSIRSSLHRCRTSKIQVMLTKGTSCSIKLASMSSNKDPVIVTEERVCFLCKRPFTESVFVSLPYSNAIAHVHCQQK